MKTKTKTRDVVALRSGNSIVLDPTTPGMLDVLAPALSYTETVFLRGKEKYDAIKNRRPPVFDQQWDCYTLDHRRRIATSFGFLERIGETLAAAGYAVTVRDLSPHPRPEVYAPAWGRLTDVEFKPTQMDALRVMAASENGRIDCPTGWGKSFVIAQFARLFYKAKFAVITRRVEVMQQRIYPELCGWLPDVGMVGGGVKKKGRRVMCYTAGSVHHATGEEDFVVFDEGHEAAADDCAYKMSVFSRARMFALSGSWDMRLDNKDMRCLAMFGPVRFRVDYATAVSHGMIVPIVVQMTDVVSDIDPCAGLEDVDRERAGVWANDRRNALIAKNSRRHGPEVQELITVKTMEHALRLKKFLPGHTLVYNESSQTPADWRKFKKLGLIPKKFRVCDDDRRAKIRAAFETGRVKKVIATTVWNVGVDMKHLQIVNRADAGGSPINDTQIPGRGSRTLVLDGKEKLCALVYDYKDQFNSGYEKKAKGRVESYVRNGWEVRQPEKADKSLLRQLMEWGEV